MEGHHHKHGDHHELTLGEIDGLRCLPQKNEANGYDAIENPDVQTTDQQLDEVRHLFPPPSGLAQTLNGFAGNSSLEEYPSSGKPQLPEGPPYFS